MTKDGFVEVLKKAGYGSAHIGKGMVTIDLVGADKDELKKAYINVGLIAKKVGYKHSFRVCKLEESEE
jgi:hypothetical protein